MRETEGRAAREGSRWLETCSEVQFSRTTTDKTPRRLLPSRSPASDFPAKQTDRQTHSSSGTAVDRVPSSLTKESERVRFLF